MGRGSLACFALSLLACGRMSFDPVATVEPDAASGAEVTDDVDVDAPTYRATAVRFESGGNDYMWMGSLLDVSNSPRGTYSAWFRFHGGDGEDQLIAVAQVIGIGGVMRTNDGRFRFLMQNCLGVPMLDMTTQGTYTTASGWVHVLASWDVSSGRADLYINDVADRAAQVTMINGPICYDSLKWGIGGFVSGTLDADVADSYAALGTYIDLGVEANRRKFRTADGQPADLGPECSAPTGKPATGCFVGDPGSWNVNKGTAAGFTLEGDGLVAAPSSPSD